MTNAKPASETLLLSAWVQNSLEGATCEEDTCDVAFACVPRARQQSIGPRRHGGARNSMTVSNKSG